MSTRPADVIRVGVAVVLGGIGAAAGFTHTHDWAESHGQTGWLAWATAIVIEGIAIVAGIEIHHDRAAGRPYRFPMVVLVFGVLVQMTAQVAEAEPTPAGWLIAAMPALGFLAVVKLLMRRLPTTPPTSAEELGEEPETVSAVTERVDRPHLAPTPDTAPAPTASTSPAAPADPSRVKLPPAIAARVAVAVDQARAEGREPSVQDIQQAARIPADLARRALANHH